MCGAATKGSRALATEFSHAVGESTMKKFPFWRYIFSPGRSAFNGRVVSVTEHALTNAYRFRFLPKAMKDVLKAPYGPTRAYFNRAPNWLQFFNFRGGTSFMESKLKF